MAYENADIQDYSWPQDATFGATGVTHQIIGPRGRVGFVRDIACEVTTSLVGTTTVPEIMLGISSGDSTYGRYRLGTTAVAGYGAGMHRASDELITGNPPRVATDFANHVILDGGPLTSQGLAGGSFGTVVPKGRIPAGPFTVTNVVSGTVASSDRYYITGNTITPGGLTKGQQVLVSGVAGVNSTANGVLTVADIDTATPPAWVELTTQTFSGTYTSGGLIMPIVIVTALAGVGGTPAGGGIVSLRIQWLGT